MFNRNWNIHITSKDRYEHTGILELAIEHLRQQKIKNPIIIDVGCSTGAAMERAASNMKALKFNPYTIGIDAAKKVRKKAEKNLDLFINKDVFEVFDNEESADIVICSKAAIFVDGPRREAIIRKCIGFLKKMGYLLQMLIVFRLDHQENKCLEFLDIFGIWFQLLSVLNMELKILKKSMLKEQIPQSEKGYSRKQNKTLSLMLMR